MSRARVGGNIKRGCFKKIITHWRLLRSGWEQQKSCSHGPSRAGKIVTGARGAVFGVFFDGCIFGRFETPLNIPVFLLGRRFRPPRGPWTPPHVAWPSAQHNGGSRSAKAQKHGARASLQGQNNRAVAGLKINTIAVPH